MLNFILLQGTPAGGPNIMNFVMIGGIIIVFYFFMIRPQQKKRKEEKTFRESIQEGSEVMTIGGLHGKIESIKDNKVVLRVDTNTRLTFERDAISTQKSFSATPDKHKKKEKETKAIKK